MRWLDRKKRGHENTIAAVTAASYWQTMAKATLISFCILTEGVFGITTTNVMFCRWRNENVSASWKDWRRKYISLDFRTRDEDCNRDWQAAEIIQHVSVTSDENTHLHTCNNIPLLHIMYHLVFWMCWQEQMDNLKWFLMMKTTLTFMEKWSIFGEIAAHLLSIKAVFNHGGSQHNRVLTDPVNLWTLGRQMPYTTWR